MAYKLKGGNDRLDLGFVAQEVETVLEVVGTVVDALRKELLTVDILRREPAQLREIISGGSR